jgi:hypothetical protein
VDSFEPWLIGCICNSRRLAIRDGFVDKAAALLALTLRGTYCIDCMMAGTRGPKDGRT